MTDPPAAAVPSLTDAQRGALRAMAFDTNSLGGPYLDLAQLEQWAERCGHNDLELWIPDVVLEEWAEHAAQAYDSLNEATSKPRAELRKVRLQPKWDVADREGVIEYVVDSVRAMTAVKVLDCDPGDAREALRDQVLQRSPGSKKGSTKTGAADSAILRTLHRSTEGKLDQVVLVTGDREAVEGICGRLGWTPPRVIPKLHTAAAALRLLEPASSEQAWALCLALAAELPTGGWNSTLIDADSFDLGQVDRLVSLELPSEVADHMQAALVATVDYLVGVADVLVDSDGSRYLAELHALCTVSAQTAAPDHNGETVYEEHELPNFLLRCRFAAQLMEGRLAGFDSSLDSVELLDRDGRAHTLRSGLEMARQALAAVPGLTGGRYPTDNGGQLKAQIRGYQVVLHTTVKDDRWQITASVGEEVISQLVCRPARSVSWGEGNYELVSEPDYGFTQQNPLWQFPAALTEALLRPPASVARR